MCGIVGYVGDKPASEILLDGLRALEYRGYDSAGIAVLSPRGRIEVRKAEGKLGRLMAVVGADWPAGLRLLSAAVATPKKPTIGVAARTRASVVSVAW